MSQDDPRAFRSHLTGGDLYHAQERLVAAILRAPSLSPVVRLAGLSRRHFPSELAGVFDFAVRSDKDEIRRAVQNRGDDVGRLFRLGVELNHAQAQQLAQQIQESIARQRPPQTQAPDADADDPVDDLMPVLKALPKAPVSEVPANGNGARPSDIVAVPGILQTGGALAQGPIAAKEIERSGEALANDNGARAGDIDAAPGIVRNGAAGGACLPLPRAATRQLQVDPDGAREPDWGNGEARQLSHDGNPGQRAGHRPRRSQDKPKRTRFRRSDTKTAACAQWLEQVLADGRARRSLELQRRARQHGLLRLGEAITRNSPLNDARKQLGVIVRRRGFGPGARYEWLLPRPSEHAPGSRFMRWTVSPRR